MTQDMKKANVLYSRVQEMILSRSKGRAKGVPQIKHASQQATFEQAQS